MNKQIILFFNNWKSWIENEKRLAFNTSQSYCIDLKSFLNTKIATVEKALDNSLEATHPNVKTIITMGRDVLFQAKEEGILEELEKRVPKGERSAFLEKLLVSALEKTGPIISDQHIANLEKE